MKNYHLTLKCLLTAALILSFISCKQKPKELQKVDAAYAEYIVAFTPPLISIADNIRIVLRESQKDITPNAEVDTKLFSFSPKIKGTTVWLDDKTIEFRPDELLPSGESFECEFQLGEIMEVPSEVKVFHTTFQTLKQAINVSYDGLKSYDYKDFTWQKVVGTATTADYAEAAKFEEVFEATQSGKKLKINWEHSDDGKTHTYSIDSILRSESRSEVILQWDAKTMQAEPTDPMRIAIPPLGDFKVLSTTFVSEPEQVIIINFSDPVNTDQEINGLIHLKSGERVKLIKDENIIKVVPSHRLNGTFTVIVENALKNSLGYQLTQRFEITKSFSTIKPKIELIGNGVIIPQSDGILFPFKAVNLSSVNVKIIKIYEDNVAQFFQVNQFNGDHQLKRVGRLIFDKDIALTSDKAIDYGTWNNFSLDLSELVQTEPGAIYRVDMDFTPEQSLYPCDGSEGTYSVNSSFDTDTELDDSEFDQPSDYYWDDYYDDYYYEDYSWREREDPCKPSYYMRGNNRVSRNVFASNLGIIAKSGDANKLLVAVTDLLNTEPVSGVDVEVYNYQDQLMETAKTDNEGFATIDLRKKPFLLVAKWNGQYGYLRLDDGSALSLSMFDVEGQRLEKGVKGFIYGERGVWRPRDTLFLSFILEDKNNQIPQNHPVVFELYTPQNQLYHRVVKTSSVNDFYRFTTTTEEESPTGNWLAKVKVGASSFTKTIKIETVKPNRLKINLDYHTDFIKGGSTAKGDLSVKWLHGAVARNLDVDVSMKLSHGKTSFKSFPKFNFDNPAKTFETEEKVIFNSSVDETGHATVNTSISVSDNAPGMLKATFRVRAFEKSGDFSIDQFSIPYSPYKNYVGVRVPEGKGWNGAIYGDEPNIIPIVSVDENGNPISRKQVKVEVYSIRWRWWWERNNEDNLANYMRSSYSEKLITQYVNTENGEGKFEMKLPENRIWGRKIIIVTDPYSGHSAGQVFYTSYKSWWRSSGGESPGGAEMLTFSTDKKEYKVGEEVSVELPPSGFGKALVSLESGSKIIDNFWVKVSEDEHSFKFVATPEMAPNIYIHLSFIQPHNQSENDHPIRLYGIQPIKVINPETILNPVIEMADELHPEKEVVIKVKEKDGKRMTYTVAVVDEGLLDLTRFKTPDAWKYFYSREALGIKTWDMYPYVMGSFTGEFAGLLAIGGDEELIMDNKQKANRFKPVVQYFGPFELKSGTNTHKFIMPNYIGSVRTMVVAGKDGAYGSTEKATPVKKPVMVLATLPRVVSPGESLKLPVTVFSMDEKITKVDVVVEANELFEFTGTKTQTVSYEQTGEKVVFFDIKVKDNIGIGKVKVTAKGGGETATNEIEIDVRIPNPRITKVTDGFAEAGNTWETIYNPVGIKGTNASSIEVSALPPLNIENRLKYLMRYPHGCIEQTTSSVFPQLFLDNLVDLTDAEKEKIENNIKAGIERIKLFQTSRGGLSYWPGEYDDENDWGTNYAGHFMIEAQKKGYDLPKGFISNWVSYQKERANAWQNLPSYSSRYYYYPHRSRQMIQAYRLYTLALAGKPAIGAMNRMREQSDLTVSAKWRLAAAYMLNGREDVALEIIEGIPKKVESYKELSYSYGSSQRDIAMILETLVLLKRTGDAKEVLDEISENMSSNRWYSTQTTAYSLMAAAKFVGMTGAGGELKFKLEVQGEDTRNISSESAFVKYDIEPDNGNKTIKITNLSEGMLFIRMHAEGIPIEDNSPDFENDLGMKIRYLDLDGNTIDPKQLSQGTDFMLEVSLTHPGIKRDYKEMALTQIFPSGWEIRNLRMEEGESTYMADEPRYMDIRDDRVFSYFDIKRAESKTFRVILNATYPGEYYMPAIYCEAMYDREISAKKGGGWVKVVME